MKEINLSEPQKIRMLLVGETDAGKSHLAASAMNVVKTLYLNPEEKFTTIAKFQSGQKQTESKVYGDINYTDIRGVFSQLSENFHYECICLDSLNRFQIASLLGILDTNRTQSQKANNEERLKTTQNDYGIVHIIMNRTLMLANKLNAHLIVTCSAERYEINDGSGSITRYEPAITGKVGNLLPGWFNIAAFMESKPIFEDKQEKIVHRLHFQSTSQFKAKCEFDGFPPYLDNPSFEEILKLTQGGDSQQK